MSACFHIKRNAAKIRLSDKCKHTNRRKSFCNLSDILKKIINRDDYTNVSEIKNDSSVQINNLSSVASVTYFNNYYKYFDRSLLLA